MNEPNMEWGEEIKEWLGCCGGDYCGERDHNGELISFISELISQAETQAYEKGKAEERERIAAGVNDERLNEMDSWDVSSKKILSLINDNK